MKLRTKIVSTYTGLIVVGVAFLSVFSSWELNNYLNRRTLSGLQTQVQLLSTLFINGSLKIDSSGINDSELNRVARIMSVRLSIVRKDGLVIYDSEVPRDSLKNLENHVMRPEIVKARQGEIGEDRRVSASVGHEFFYTAKMVNAPALGTLDSSFVRIALPVQEIHMLDLQVQAIIWLIGLVTICVIAAVSYRLSSRITRPILHIASTAESIKNGDVQQRVAITSRDEIGALSRSINGMAEKLSSDIAQLRKLEHIRSEFLANVSHELRTPIFSIQGFLETLIDGAVDDPAVNREFLEKAHSHASRLNALLNDLIEISRIESGEMKMSFRYFPVVEFLKQIVEEMRGQAEKKGLTLTLIAEVEPTEKVYGDQERLKQVMINLIDNAVKYTDTGGSINCRVKRQEEYCLIQVEDTGSGIPPEHLARIFERFYRVDRDRSREVGGTGLGLAIVKHIVEAHGSSISVSSTVGKGSLFSFTLKR